MYYLRRNSSFPGQVQEHNQLKSVIRVSYFLLLLTTFLQRHGTLRYHCINKLYVLKDTTELAILPI